jgi:hypothetical protein
MTRFAFVVLTAAASVCAQDAPERLPHKVTILGDEDKRTEDFAALLRQRFADVKVEKHGVDPATLRARDVVVLDWKQSVEALRKGDMHCPLGEREEWTTPAVLIGSAGLMLACCWDVLGGFG